MFEWSLLGKACISCDCCSLLKKVTVVLWTAPKEVETLRVELEKLHFRIRKAVDEVAVAEEGDNRKLMKEKVTDLRRIYFSIEDVVDDWRLCDQHEKMNKEREHCDYGCVILPCKCSKCFNIRCCDRFQIALKTWVINFDHGAEIKSSLEQRQSSSTINPDVAWKKILQMSPYSDQTEILGFKAQSDELISWLEDGRANCNVMVLVGMAGQGKTTLVKQIFHNEEVIGKFKRKVWIRVSDYDSPNDFFKFLLNKLYQQTDDKKSTLQYGFDKMGLESLKSEVKDLLNKQRYALFFDDVWNKKFWQEIKHTVVDDKYPSRIIITTRNKEVAKTCMRSSVDVKVHEMQPLTDQESLKLFCQVAYKLDIDDGNVQIPNLPSDILKTCNGLPLGLVAMGRHVPVENTHAFRWKSIIQETGITEILSLSYDYLPNHLKPCLLYFGIYPQDYEVKSKRLIRQWIAEGFVFVNHENGKTIEEVAEDYLTGLIDRNLVQVSSFTIDGKPKSCHVHCLVHDMIRRKFEDLSFCLCINQDNRSDVSGITRHLSIATNSTEGLPRFFDALAHAIENSFIRSLHFFTEEDLPPHYVNRIPAKYKTLKVLDFENSKVSYVFKDLGYLIHLKYLSFRNTEVPSLPKSIGKLTSLETMDLRGSSVNVLPKEVSKLRKLRHLLGDQMSLIQLKDDIGGMSSLQTLRDVKIDEGVGLIEKELENLWHIRDLGLTNVGQIHGSALCSAINKMHNLVKLSIIAKESANEVIDLQKLKKPSMLQKLRLQGKLNSLPTWVPDLDCLVKLILSGSKLTNDPLNSLKHIPNLLFLSIINEAYEGENFNFQGRDFKYLKELEIGSLSQLNSITIHNNEALPSLKKLAIRDSPELKTAPLGLQHLQNLKDLTYKNMPTEFGQSISAYVVQWRLQIINHMPRLRINGELVN